jgi:hypothetical protein
MVWSVFDVSGHRGIFAFNGIQRPSATALVSASCDRVIGMLLFTEARRN